MKVNKEEYLKLLIPTIMTLRNKRKVVNLIKENLKEYKFYPGDVQEFLNDPEGHLDVIDHRKLFLFGKQIWLQSRNEKIDPDKFFTEREIERAESWSGKLEVQEEFKLPFVFERVISLGHNKWLTYLSAKTGADGMNSGVFDYNFDIQREPVRIIDEDGNVHLKPKTNKNNIREISEHARSGTLEPTQIVLNIPVLNSDFEALEYNEEKGVLILNKGSKMDIVDGYHRLSGIQIAMEMNPDINFKFPLLITHYDDEQAKKYQAQFAKGEKISEARQVELENKNFNDYVVTELKIKSKELKDRISSRKVLLNKRDAKEIISFNDMSDAIKESFNIRKRSEVSKISNYLAEFFDYIIGDYRELFDDYRGGERVDNLLNTPIMTVGLIELAARMYNEGIEALEVIDCLDKIDFNRENQEWIKWNIVDEKKHLLALSNRSAKGVREYFRSIEL